jgi:hypothetical protein
VAITSCDDAGDRRATDGPLVALVGSGGSSLDAPRGRTRWTGTFGHKICAENGLDIEIESVSYHSVVPPVAIRTVVRTAPDRSERRGPRQKWTPIGTYVGGIRQLRGKPYLSSSVRNPEGVKVQNSCDQDGPDDAYTELVTSITTDRRGGWVDEATIAYSSGGRDYELDIHWTYITCGTAINELWTDDSMPAPCTRPRS